MFVIWSRQTLKARSSTRIDMPHMTRNCILSLKVVGSETREGKANWWTYQAKDPNQLADQGNTFSLHMLWHAAHDKKSQPFLIWWSTKIELWRLYKFVKQIFPINCLSGKCICFTKSRFSMLSFGVSHLPSVSTWSLSSWIRGQGKAIDSAAPQNAYNSGVAPHLSSVIRFVG